MASCSSGLKRDVQEFGRGFAMFKAFGNHAERQRLYAGDSFIPVGAVAHDAGQGGHLGKPATVVFAFDLDRKHHAGYCTIRRAVSQAFGPEAPTVLCNPSQPAGHLQAFDRQDTPKSFIVNDAEFMFHRLFCNERATVGNPDMTESFRPLLKP